MGKMPDSEPGFSLSRAVGTYADKDRQGRVELTADLHAQCASIFARIQAIAPDFVVGTYQDLQHTIHLSAEVDGSMPAIIQFEPAVPEDMVPAYVRLTIPLLELPDNFPADRAREIGQFLSQVGSQDQTRVSEGVPFFSVSHLGMPLNFNRLSPDVAGEWTYFNNNSGQTHVDFLHRLDLRLSLAS